MNKRLSSDTLKKIRQIEICTRRLLNSSLVGDSRSAVKGSGLEFDQIREYQMGDDIRFIDWSGSARMNKLLVRQYIEERNRTIIIALDVSASGSFSSGVTMRRDLMAQLASVLALVADYGKDYVGLVLFSHEVECYIPPHKGKSHIRSLMEKAFSHTSRHTTTNIAHALSYIAGLNKKDALVVVISDFIDESSFEKPLRHVARRHDVIALRCLDSHEQTLPPVGFITVQDPETGALRMLDMRSGSGKSLHHFLSQRLQDQATIFKKAGVDYSDLYLNRPFIADIITLFRRRMMY